MIDRRTSERTDVVIRPDLEAPFIADSPAGRHGLRIGAFFRLEVINRMLSPTRLSRPIGCFS